MSKILGITTGDASGIGPEILLKSHRDGLIQRPVVVYGDLAALAHYNRLLNYNVSLRAIYSPSDLQSADALHVMDHGILVDNDIMQNIGLPSELLPVNPVNGSAGVAQFFMLDDKKTGVLALGSFSDASYERLQKAMLDGLLNLKAQGATQLIVDIVCLPQLPGLCTISQYSSQQTGNGGGYICLAHVSPFPDHAVM